MTRATNPVRISISVTCGPCKSGSALALVRTCMDPRVVRASGYIGDGDFGSLGIEMLFYMQPNHWQIQPYFGIGPAIYYNFLNYETDGDEDKLDESGVGLGGVIKVGLRAFVTQQFFRGMSLKGFSNSWNLDIDENQDKTLNFGGGVLAFELGFTF